MSPSLFTDDAVYAYQDEKERLLQVFLNMDRL